MIYQALYRGSRATDAARAAAFRGVVFVTLRTRARAGRAAAARSQRYLRWCLVDRDPATPQRRAWPAPAGCEHGRGATAFETARQLHFGGRDWSCA